MDNKAASRKERMKEITDKLEAGIEEIYTSGKYTAWLDTMSRFHKYSLNNSILIMMQKPDATMVAGYSQWQKDFERNVKKGEKAIRIIAWNPYNRDIVRNKIDPVTKLPIRDENGNYVKEEATEKVPSFRVVSVFDISQTEGKELPNLGVNELEGQVDNYTTFFEALKRTCPVPIEFKDIQTGAKGYFQPKEQRITIKEGMSDIQTIKTTVHEMAHQKLHSNREENAQTRSGREIEAESVAYTVCQHFGIDTSEYSFGYVAAWANDKELVELKASLLTIRNAASSMIDDIEGHIKEINLEVEKRVEQGVELIAEMPAAAEILAEKLDSFAYAHDTYSYNDTVSNREKALESLKDDLLTDRNSMKGVEDFLDGVIDNKCSDMEEAKNLKAELAKFRATYHEPDKNLVQKSNDTR